MRARELKFLTGARLSKRYKLLGYRVRLFDPRGIYPAGTKFVPNGFFHADDDLVFSVVRGEDWTRLDSEIPYSEFDWASPQELRLFASMMFCEKREDRRMCLYPLRYGHRLDVRKLDLTRIDTVNRLKDFVLEEVRKPDRYGAPSDFLRRSTRPYDLESDSTFAFDRLLTFWHGMGDLDFLLLRGAYALMKADMLTSHLEFYEEGIVSCYIALDASYAYILGVLKAQGIKNPTANDAQMWVHNCFDKAFGLPEPSETSRYFEDFYRDRIMTLHPSSRFGEVPYAPIMHGDYIHLRRSLREIFAYLVSGEHGEDYHSHVREMRRLGNGTRAW
jgi:hypothetical protein